MEVAIKYIESLFAVNKGSKFNIYAVASTDDSKVQKIGSNMYATHADIESLYNASIIAKGNGNRLLECELSTGTCRMRKYNPPTEQKVTIYNVSIGGINSRMSERAYNEFIESVEDCYKILANKSNIFSFFKRKRRIKKERKGIFD